MTDHERQGTGYDPDARGHELQGRDRDPKVGVDLSSGPDRGGYICGQCGFEASDADEMLAHNCPNRPGAAAAGAV